MQVFKTQNPDATDFFWDVRRMDQFNVVFHCEASPLKPKLVWVAFHAAIKHPGVLTQAAVGFGVLIGIRGPVVDPATFPGDPMLTAGTTWIPGGTCGKNILNPTQHYEQAVIPRIPYPLTAPGYYRIEVWANARTDAVPINTNGLLSLEAEPNILNALVVEVEE